MGGSSPADQYGSTQWRLNKKDKRTVKHNGLLARVQDARVVKKRRRPAKKLKGDIGGLRDALPDVEPEAVAHSEDEWEGISEDEGRREEAISGIGHVDEHGLRVAKRRKGQEQGKMEMRSLKHRPGAMKRRRKMEQGEMERFTKNLAQMATPAGGGGNDGQGASRAERWSALRSFIETTTL